MRILKDRESVAAIDDDPLRSLIEERIRSLDDFDDYELQELVKIIVVESGDSIDAINKALGFPVLDRPFELIEQHPHWYEIVFVTGDDGSGVELFVPIEGDVPEALLAMCLANSFRAPDT